MSDIKSISFRTEEKPLKTTFSTALGKKDTMRSVIVDVLLKDGSRGVGECPTSFVLPLETPGRIMGLIRDISARFLGFPIKHYEKKIEELRREYPGFPMTISGLEVAMFRASLACTGSTEHQYWGGNTFRLETDITIPILHDDGTRKRWIGKHAKKGFSTWKLKVSGDVDEDRRVISSVFHLLSEGPGNFAVRLDGNQGYTEKTFFKLIDFLEKNNHKPQLFEQPLPKDDYKGLSEITKRSPIPIILDETVFTEKDLLFAVDNNLGHGINIKISKSGIKETSRLMAVATKQGMRLMMGCMMETMTGLSAGIFCASGTGIFDYIDLDAVHFLYHRGHSGGIVITGPAFSLFQGDRTDTVVK